MDTTQIAQFISQVGFPIAVAAYLLLQGTKERKEMTDALNGLKIAIEKISMQIGGKNE